MLSGLFHCALFQGACTATDEEDDVKLNESKTNARALGNKLLKQCEQLQNQQETIRVHLLEYKHRLTQTIPESERASTTQQCAILIASYKKNAQTIITLMNSYDKLETTKTTLHTAQLMNDTVEAQRALVAKTSKAFKGKTTDDLVKQQIHTEAALQEYQEMTEIISQTEDDRSAMKYGLGSTDSRVSIANDIDAILGTNSSSSSTTVFPEFPQVITTPLSLYSSPYASSSSVPSLSVKERS